MSREPLKIYNFIHTSSDQRTIDLIFGDFEPDVDVVQRFDNTWDLTAIALACKLYPSRSKAKEAGWRGPIETGLHKYPGRHDTEKVFVFKPNLSGSSGPYPVAVKSKPQPPHLLPPTEGQKATVIKSGGNPYDFFLKPFSAVAEVIGDCCACPQDKTTASGVYEIEEGKVLDERD